MDTDTIDHARCPFCGWMKHAVVDKRTLAGGIKRHRKCPKCDRRWRTWERWDLDDIAKRNQLETRKVPHGEPGPDCSEFDLDKAMRDTIRALAHAHESLQDLRNSYKIKPTNG